MVSVCQGSGLRRGPTLKIMYLDLNTRRSRSSRGTVGGGEGGGGVEQSLRLVSGRDPDDLLLNVKSFDGSVESSCNFKLSH